MAQTNLADYKAQIAADPEATNEGAWYARSTIHHDAETYKAGQKLPELTNAQVLQLLEVNALTSVAPAEAAPAASTTGAGQEQ